MGYCKQCALRCIKCNTAKLKGAFEIGHWNNAQYYGRDALCKNCQDQEHICGSCKKSFSRDAFQKLEQRQAKRQRCIEEMFELL